MDSSSPSPVVTSTAPEATAPPPLSGLAIASMVLGICAVPLAFAPVLGLILCVLAIVFGHVSLSTIRRAKLGGRGMAIAGLVLGYAGIALMVALLVVLVTSRNAVGDWTTQQWDAVQNDAANSVNQPSK